MLLNYVAVAIGGALGCAARYGVNDMVSHIWGRSFPLATLLVNLLGSFLLGFLFFETLERLTLSPEMRLALLTGGLGGFTTFSTFMVESLLLVEDGELMKALSYVLVSVLLGFCAAFLGAYLSRNL